MEVTLPPEQATFVGDQIEAGAYASAEEVVAAGIASLQASLSKDNASIARGIAEAEAGKGDISSEVFDRLSSRYKV